MRTPIFASALLLLVACAAAHVPPPTLGDAGGDEGRLRTLSAGRELYVAKCSGCHRLYSVEAYDDAAWEKNVDAMIRLKKVRLDPEERSALLDYLQRMNTP